MRFAICNEIFADWPPARVFAYCAALGYDAVEIAPFTLAPRVTSLDAAARRQLRRQAEDAGVAISGLHWLLARTEGLHLTSPDPEVRHRTAEYFVELTHCCADLGGGTLVLGSPRQRQLEPGASRADGTARALEVLRPAVRVAERRGVTLCVEPLPREDTNFLNTAAAAREFVAGCASEHVKVILDVRAMCHEDEPIPQLIAATRGMLGYFHANDVNLKGPGFGAVDFQSIAQALHESGYDGTVSVEVFDFTEGPEVIATRSLETLRRAFGRSGQ